MKSLLNVLHLKKNYHDQKGETTAIEDVSFDVAQEEFISIVGPSGCGKSTLLSILAGLSTKSDGTFQFQKEKPQIGYMLQKDSLFPWRTILENCCLGLEINRSLNEDTKKRVIHLLDTYGLGDFKDQYPRALSGGMRQRAALIRTLAIDPDILLLDEPYSALDYQTRLALSDDVYHIIRKEKKTAIMVTHDLGEAISMSDRIIVLSKRPATIKKIYEIVIPNAKTPSERRKTKEFSIYYDQIWRDLDVHI